ncbi:MAG TPA: sulfur carrier protein ThiS [Burkholderiales bacterium]|nr:sulfur carrier protein ThiS [Burkholderiales bacterium]
MALTINGEPRHFDERLNLTQLLEKLELKGRRLALERNGEIVPRSRFNDEILRDGDQLEIVIAVGGG